MSRQDVAAFGPTSVSTLAVSVTTASSSPVDFTGTVGRNKHVRVVNTGSNTAYVEIGGSAVAASVPSGSTPGSMPVLAATTSIFTAAGGYVAAITASSTTTLFVTPGEGT